MPSVQHQVLLPTMSPWSSASRQCDDSRRARELLSWSTACACDLCAADAVRLDVYQSGNPTSVAPGANKAHMRRRYALSRHNIADRHHHRARSEASAWHLQHSSKASPISDEPVMAVFNSTVGPTRAACVAKLLPDCSKHVIERRAWLHGAELLEHLL